jgi:hypothetical protein
MRSSAAQFPWDCGDDQLAGVAMGHAARGAEVIELPACPRRVTLSTMCGIIGVLANRPALRRCWSRR